MPIGISVIEGSAPAVLGAGVDSIDSIYVVATSDEETLNLNTPTVISKDTYLTDYPNLAEISRASIVAIYENYPQAKINFVNAGKITGSSATEKLTSALEELGKTGDLELGYLLVPELSTLPNTGGVNERSDIFSKAETVAKGKGWLHFVQISDEALTVEDAKKERAVYFSELGSSAAYYGSVPYTDPNPPIPNPDGSPVFINAPVAAIATAIASKATNRETVNQSPAGISYPIIATTVNNYVSNDGDLDELADNGINVPRLIQPYGYILYGARTLSIDPNFKYINTRQCISSIAATLRSALLPYFAEPIDPNGQTTQAVILDATSIMESAFTSGKLSGNTSADAYTIVQRPPKDNTIEIDIYARFVNTVEQIVVYLFSR